MAYNPQPCGFVKLTSLLNDLDIKSTKRGRAYRHISSLLVKGGLNLEGDYSEIRHGSYAIRATHRVKSIIELELIRTRFLSPPPSAKGFTPDEYCRIMSYPAVDPVAYMRNLIKQAYGD